MAWFYLIVAALFEIGWPLGMKLSLNPDRRMLGIAMAASFMLVSGVFLWLAQREIPIGTAYVVWTGIGAAGTFVLGIVLFGDSVSAMRIGWVALILVGVIGLKLTS